MFSRKDKYFLFADNTTELNVDAIKIKDKFVLIYRNTGKNNNFDKLKN